MEKSKTEVLIGFSSRPLNETIECIFKNSEKIIASTFGFNKKILENLLNLNKDQEVHILIDKKTYLNKIEHILDIENKFNCHFESVGDNHIKSIFGIKENNEVRVLFGSFNLTKNGIYENNETAVFQSTFCDPKELSKIKWSNYSVICGLARRIYEENVIYLNEKKEIFKNLLKLSKKPIEIYEGQKYFEKIKKSFEKINEYEGKTKVKIITHKLNQKLLNDILEEIDKDKISLEVITNVHAKKIIFEYPDGSLSLGFGSSNFTKNGFGIVNKEIKTPEANIYIKLSSVEKEYFNDIISEIYYLNKKMSLAKVYLESKRIFHDPFRGKNRNSKDIEIVKQIIDNYNNKVKMINKIIKSPDIDKNMEKQKKTYQLLEEIIVELKSAQITDKKLKNKFSKFAQDLKTILNVGKKYTNYIIGKNKDIESHIKKWEEFACTCKMIKKIKKEDQYNKKYIIQSVTLNQIL